MNKSRVGIAAIMVLSWIALFGLLLYGVPRLLSLKTRGLVIAAWGDIIDAEVVRQFTHKTGIPVTLSYYASNEELLVKLSSTQGAGYDIIVPSDYIIPQLVAQGLLHPLDHTRLTHLDRICPELRGLAGDTHNTYVIPWMWEPYLIAYDTRAILPDQAMGAGWDLIFNPHHRLVMVNDALEMILCAGMYLYQQSGSYTAEQEHHIVNLLRAQHPWVTAYADARGDHFLITGAAQVLLASSSYIMRALRHHGHIGWLLPQPHSFVTVEHIALVATSHQHEQAYLFLNYLYERSSVRRHIEAYALLPATDDLDISDGVLYDLFGQARKLFSTLLFFTPSVNRITLHKMWLSAKS